MTPHDMIRHEWKTHLLRPTSLVCLALYAAVLGYGVMHGRQARDARQDAIAAHRARVATQQAKWRSDMEARSNAHPQTPPRPTTPSPMRVTFASALPPGPLADFAVGQSDLLPGFGTISLWAPDIRLFSRYELEDPVSLAYGAFGLSWAVVLLLPLVLLVLCFDVLSADRDTRRLGLILAQGTGARRLVWGRILTRAGVVGGLTLLAALVALFVPGGDHPPGERLPYFALWLTGAFLYGGFWVAVIAAVAARNRDGEFNATRLVLLWAGLTLLVPATAAATAELVYPTPSRLAYLAEARKVEVETKRSEANLAQRFLLEHPELIEDHETTIPAYVRTAFVVTSQVDNATKPLLSSFENTARRRDDTVSVLRYLSPAIVVHQLFNDVAGTSADRHRRYQAQARAFKAAFADRVARYVMTGRRLPPEEIAALPEFRFTDAPFEDIVVRHLGGLFALVVAIGVLLVLADRRLRGIVGPGENATFR